MKKLQDPKLSKNEEAEKKKGERERERAEHIKSLLTFSLSIEKLTVGERDKTFD